MTESETPWYSYPLIIFGCLGVLVYTLICMAAALAFLEGYWGWSWFLASAAVLVIMVVTRGALLPPLTFFGAWIVWKWPFVGALAIAAPVLALVLFALTAGGIAALFARGKRFMARTE